MGTLVVLLLLATVIAVVIRKLIRDKKAGKTLQCGGDCGSCGGGCKKD